MSRPRVAKVDQNHHGWWKTVQTEWPLRLLHIPTMTSIERKGKHTYGTDEKPAYCILTYTWGRFTADWDSPALEVKGTAWKIPPVKESCFTVDAFQRVIQAMGYEADYAWVDVACIDQENGDVKMYEVGRQVGIFKGAKRAYVWLHSFNNAELKSLFDDILEYGPQITHPDIDFGVPFQPRGKTPNEYSGLPTVVPRLQRSFERLFNDPWFTSLWTLQESVLRRDAMVLCRDANSVTHPWSAKQDVHLAVLANTCRNVYRDLQGTLETANLSPELRTAVQDLIARIEKAGFHFLYTRNPNVQYGASKFRQTKYPLDRIYGIMQIYGIAVGEAAEPGQTVQNMEELEDQFAAALNARSAVLGQSFIHVSEPVDGKSWQITQNSGVPWAIMEFDQNSPQSHCTILRSASDAAVTITGPACSLQRLEELWQVLAWKVARERFGAKVMLDNNSIVRSHNGQAGWNFGYTVLTIGSPANDYITCRWLMSDFPPADLLVVSLGKTVLEMVRSDYLETYLGLIIYRDARDGFWRRIGICKWDVYPSRFEAHELALWKEISVTLH